MRKKDFILKLKPEVVNEFIVTDMAPYYKWDNDSGKPTDVLLGWKLRTVNPSAGYSETIVKIDGDTPPLEAEQVEREPITVAFEQLEFTQYISTVTKRQEYIGHATGLKILK